MACNFIGVAAGQSKQWDVKTFHLDRYCIALTGVSGVWEESTTCERGLIAQHINAKLLNGVSLAGNPTF